MKKHPQVSFIEQSVRGELLGSIPGLSSRQNALVSSINSLHHLSFEDVRVLLKSFQSSRRSFFVLDPARLHPWHPVLVPLLYHPLYCVLALFGSSKHFHGNNIARRVFTVVVESWIMCFDQIAGSSRRYSNSMIGKLAEEYDFEYIIERHSIMNYILMKQNI